MKQGKKIVWLSAFTACALCMAVACSDKDNSPKVEVLPPEITATDEGIFWTGAENAKGYKYRFNDGKYKKVSEDERQVSFPTQTGDYTFEIYTVGADMDSESAKFLFSVKNDTPTAIVQDNLVTFTGEHIWYSVDGGQECELVGRDSLDFSAAEVGRTYSISYYCKGGFWSDSENAYYVDGAKQTVEVSVSTVLSMPELTAEGNFLVIGQVEHATAYEVKIDGAQVSPVDNKIAFPESLGEHVISVRAIGGGGYKNSAERVYEMQTVAQGVPSVTYSESENQVAWSSDYIGVMTLSTGDGFDLASGNTVAVSDGLQLRLNATYDETERTYYLASKTLSVEKRVAPQIAFTKDGEISWNKTDEGLALAYYISCEADGENFVETKINRMNVSGYPAGEYVCKIYGSQYLLEESDSAIFFVPGEIGEIEFLVLEKPTLDFSGNKLLWEKDDLAFGYEYKVDSGVWETAGNLGSMNVSLFATYSLRALGNETAGAYVVNSMPTSITFDPTLKIINSENRVEELVTFDNAKYAQYVSAPIAAQSTGKGDVSVITTSADSAEQAILNGATGGVLKLVATAKSPKNENLWGNSDGMQFELFKSYPVDAESSIVFRVYMKSNALRTTTGWLYPDKQTTVDLEGRIAYGITGVSKETGLVDFRIDYATIQTDQWVDCVVNLSSYTNYFSKITGVALFFQNVGKAGDVIYVDGVNYLSPVHYETTDGFSFDFSTANSLPEFVDNTKASLVSLNGVQALKVDVTGLVRPFIGLDINLKAGQKIVMEVLACVNNTGSGTTKIAFQYWLGSGNSNVFLKDIIPTTESAATARIYTYEVTGAESNLNLKGFQFYPTGADHNATLYIKSICIVDKNASFDNAAGATTVMDFSDCETGLMFMNVLGSVQVGGGENMLRIDLTDNAKHTILTFVESEKLSEGDKIIIEFGGADFGFNIYLDDTQIGYSGTDAKTVEYEVGAGLSFGELKIKRYGTGSNNTLGYTWIKSITVVRAN